jgi:hypothetical protein
MFYEEVFSISIGRDDVFLNFRCKAGRKNLGVKQEGKTLSIPASYSDMGRQSSLSL